MTIVVLGAVTTMVLGLKPYAHFAHGDELLTAVALVLSAAIPIFAAWEAFFDHRWLWVRYTAMLSSLYAIQEELKYAHAAGEMDEAKLDSLFERLQGVLEAENREWLSKRQKEIERPKDGVQ